MWLMASTCAGYDDAQICCEHGEEGGQNVSLTAELHETTMTSGSGGPGRCCFHFSCCCAFLSSSHLTPYHQLVFISVRGSLMKAGGGWREPPAVACSSRNAA